jgi:HD-like signal output (HDOD) protein
MLVIRRPARFDRGSAIGEGGITVGKNNLKDTALAVLSLKQLPPLAPGASRILESLERDDADLTQLSHLIEKSPSAAARIITVANSAYFGLSSPANTLPRAISVIGFKLTRSLVVAMVLGDALDTRHCPKFDAQRYWLNALLTASLARALAPLVHGVEPIDAEEAYLAGLFHRIGLPVLVHLFPDEVERAFEATNGPLGERLRTALQVNHGIAGTWVLRKWRLPDTLARICEHARDPGYQGPGWPAARLVAACAEWADAVVGGDEQARPPSLAALGIDVTGAERACARCLAEREALNAFAAMLFPR